ncbi:MAG: inositol monophosphatase family protein [Planctomycetota bacterium]|jgi:fructose-1,6-bisphosphatase/inositol monophosphatase family enzyme
MTLTPLEQRCLESFRRSGDCWPEHGRHAEDDGWIQFALAAVLHAGRVVREVRMSPVSGQAVFKADASPVTAHEREIEGVIRSQLSTFSPGAAFMGEESGGAVEPAGISVVVDPVDGTWALLNRMTTCAVVIAAFRDGRPFLGAVANPATGELAYSVAECVTRLIQFDWIGEHHRAAEMPLDRVRPSSVLVNVHPSREAGPLLERLMTAWQSSEVQMLRMEGGSPAASLLEVAKGSFVYVNLWNKRPSEPYDLVAGVQLVRNAGGRVVGLDGRDIDASSHAGPLVAGVDEQARERVLGLVASLPR